MAMFDVGSQIVHPLHGAGEIEEIVIQKMDGVKKAYYRLRLSENRMVVLIPVEGAEKIGIRPISSPDTFKEVMKVFRDGEIVFNRNWNARYHENLSRIKSGNLCEMAGVIKTLVFLEKERGLASGERKMLYNAKKVLYSELALIEGKDFCEIEREINRAVDKKNKE